MNHHAPDVIRRSQAHLLPRLPSIQRLINPISPRRALPIVRLSRPDPHNGRIGRSDRNVTNSRHILFVKHRLPRRPVIRRLPHPTRRRPHKNNVRIAFDDAEIVDAPPHHRGPDLSKLQILQLFGRAGLPCRPTRRNDRQSNTKHHRGQTHLQSRRSTIHFLPPSVEGRASYLLNASARINCFRNGKPTRVQTDARRSLRVSLSCFEPPSAFTRGAASGPAPLGYTSPHPRARLSNCFHRTNVPRESSLSCQDYVRAPFLSLACGASLFSLWANIAGFRSSTNPPAFRQTRRCRNLVSRPSTKTRGLLYCRR